MKVNLFLFWLCAAASAASALDAPPGNGPAYTDFDLITARNIFNANRSRRGATGESEAKEVRVESITLVGTLSYEKGPYAFFDGSTSEYRQVLEPGKTIAGYTVASVAGDTVQLRAGERQIELHVGMQLQRENDSDWKVRAGSFVPGGGSNAAASAASSESDDSDTIKRLMQQREQELK